MTAPRKAASRSTTPHDALISDEPTIELVVRLVKGIGWRSKPPLKRCSPGLPPLGPRAAARGASGAVPILRSRPGNRVLHVAAARHLRARHGRDAGLPCQSDQSHPRRGPQGHPPPDAGGTADGPGVDHTSRSRSRCSPRPTAVPRGAGGLGRCAIASWWWRGSKRSGRWPRSPSGSRCPRRTRRGWPSGPRDQAGSRAKLHGLKES